MATSSNRSPTETAGLVEAQPPQQFEFADEDQIPPDVRPRVK
jgi:hypothetical protein